jgi:hypothetical protein
MNVPGQNHRDAWFAPFFKNVLQHTKFLFQTKSGTPFIFPGVAHAPPQLIKAAHTQSARLFMLQAAMQPCIVGWPGLYFQS